MNADQEYIWNGVLTMYEGFIEKNRPKIDKFINDKHENAENNEDENRCEKLFLGWISNSWVRDYSPEVSKQHKCIIKDSMQHMVRSWDERNEQVHAEKSRKENLKKRFAEHDENREKFEPFVGEFVDDVLKNADDSNADMLRIKLEILIDKIKRRKKET